MFGTRNPGYPRHYQMVGWNQARNCNEMKIPRNQWANSFERYLGDGCWFNSRDLLQLTQTLLTRLWLESGNNALLISTGIELTLLQLSEKRLLWFKIVYWILTVIIGLRYLFAGAATNSAILAEPTIETRRRCVNASSSLLLRALPAIRRPR